MVREGSLQLVEVGDAPSTPEGVFGQPLDGGALLDGPLGDLELLDRLEPLGLLGLVAEEALDLGVVQLGSSIGSGSVLAGSTGPAGAFALAREGT